MDRQTKMARASINQRSDKDEFQEDRFLLDTDPSNYVDMKFGSYLAKDGALGYKPVFICKNCDDDLRWIYDLQKFECPTCGCALSTDAAMLVCERYAWSLTKLIDSMTPKQIIVKKKKRGWRWPWARS